MKINLTEGVNEIALQGTIRLIKHGDKLSAEVFEMITSFGSNCGATTIQNKPRFKHDCDCLLVEGNVLIDEKFYDLYIHYPAADEYQFIPLARFGNEPADFVVGASFIGLDKPITIVFEKAISKGLFKFLNIDVSKILRSNAYLNYTKMEAAKWQI